MGVVVVLAGAVEAVYAGWNHWPWYSVFVGVVIAMIGFALHQPVVISLQRKRGGLCALLANLAAFRAMVFSLLYAVGKIGIALVN